MLSRRAKHCAIGNNSMSCRIIRKMLCVPSNRAHARVWRVLDGTQSQANRSPGAGDQRELKGRTQITAELTLSE